MSELSDVLSFHLRAAGIRGYAREYLFHPTRRWRFDFAWPAERIAVEVDGGQWLQGTGHNSGTGRERDAEKDAEALLLGWKVFRFPTSMITDGRALAFVERALEGPGRANCVSRYSDMPQAKHAKI